MALSRRDGEHQRETYARSAPFLSGETVTPGAFKCQRCGHRHQVPNGTVTNLPVCPRCQHDRWDAG